MTETERSLRYAQAELLSSDRETVAMQRSLVESKIELKKLELQLRETQAQVAELQKTIVTMELRELSGDLSYARRSFENADKAYTKACAELSEL